MYISFMPNNIIKNVNATTTLLTINNGKSYVSYTCVYENKFIVINGTYILEYNLDTLVLDNSYNLGGSVAISDTLLKGQQLYIKYVDGGVTKYGCFDIPSFTLLDYQTDAKFTDYTGILKELAYLEDNGKDYWCWLVKSTSGAIKQPNGYVFPTLDSTKIYKRFGILFNVGFNGYPYSITLDQYVYNATSDTLGYQRQTITSSTAYEGWGVWARLTTAYVQDGYTPIKYYSGTSDYYMGSASIQLQEIINDASNNSYVSYGYYGMRKDTFTATTTCSEANANIYAFMDIENTWFRMQSNTPNILKIASFTKGVFGSISSVTLHYNSYLATQQKGVASIGKYYDNSGTLCTYVAYVDTSKNVYAEKIVGATATVKGSYTPSASTIYVYSGDKNFVVVYTVASTNHLYVYVALLPSSEIGGYGANIIAQLYKAYVSSGTFMYQIKFMQNNSYYTPLSNDLYDYYINNVLITHNGYLDVNGIVSVGYYTTSSHTELCYLINKTGFNPKWFNMTLYSITPLTLKILDVDREKPIITVSAVDTNATSSLLLTINIKRFTGELFTNDYFKVNPKINIVSETFGLNLYYSQQNVAPYEIIGGISQAQMSYQKPNTYRIGIYYDTALIDGQYGILRNITYSSSYMLGFDSVSHVITTGNYITIPTPFQSGYYYNDQPQLPSGTGTLTPNIIYGMVNWLPTMIVILLPAIVLMGLCIETKAPIGVTTILFLIGLNIGVGISVWVALTPFYFMLMMILLDAILFVFMLKSGGGGGNNG